MGWEGSASGSRHDYVTRFRGGRAVDGGSAHAGTRVQHTLILDAKTQLGKIRRTLLLAIPLLAGPSTLAALLLLKRAAPEQTLPLFTAVTIAWAICGGILLGSTFFYRLLRERGLVAMERLMGMLLVMVAVQMFMNGIRAFLAR